MVKKKLEERVGKCRLSGALSMKNGVAVFGCAMLSVRVTLRVTSYCTMASCRKVLASVGLAELISRESELLQ